MKAKILAYAIRGLLRVLLSTCKIEVNGVEHLLNAKKAGPVLMMLWHNRLGIIADLQNRIAPQFVYSAFVSQSKDGEILAALTESYPIGRTIRVPHNKRDQAFRIMLSHLRYGKEIIILTPDGPKGPRYECKPGIVIAARESKASIVQWTWSASKFWQLGTWDKLIIPKPFSKICLFYGEPVQLNTEEQPEEQQKMLTERLNKLTDAACTAAGATPL